MRRANEDGKMTYIGKGKTKEVLMKIAAVSIILESEKKNMTLESYRKMDGMLNEITNDIFGVDGVLKVQKALLEYIRKGKTA